MEKWCDEKNYINFVTVGSLLLKEQTMLKPANKEELKEIIENRIQTEGPECNLNDIDVSGITDMSELFKGCEFNGDISKWNIRPDCDTRNMFG